MAYIEIDGLRTWYDEAGSGEPLVLLHGGLERRLGNDHADPARDGGGSDRLRHDVKPGTAPRPRRPRRAKSNGRDSGGECLSPLRQSPTRRSTTHSLR
jgi:hypothetical protein